MKKLLPFLILPLFIFIGCEDEDEVSACDQYFLDADATGWADMLEDFMAASQAGDASYVYPENWTSTCNAFYDLSIANVGCFDDDEVTEASLTEDRAICTINEM